MHALPRRRVITTALASVGLAGGLRLAAATDVARAAAAGGADSPLFAGSQDPVLGNPAGHVPIAEFYDYRCPYCREMHPVISRLLAQENDIRFVAKNWPILGPASKLAARVALAANWQGRFPAVNDALFAVSGKLSEANIRGAAAQAGVDMARLDRDLTQRAEALDAALADVMLDAASLGLQGTPAFVIGSQVVRGALSYDDLRGLVARVRAQQPRRI